MKLTAPAGLALFLCISGFAQTDSTCPVQIPQVHPHWIVGSGDPWGSYLLIGFKNVSTKTISAIRFGVEFVDSLGDAHMPIFLDSDITVKPGKTNRPVWTDGVYVGAPGTKVAAKVWVEKIRFSDASIFGGDGTRACAVETKLPK